MIHRLAKCSMVCRRLMAKSTISIHGAVNDMPIVKHRSMVSGTTLRVMGRQALGLQSWRVARRFTTMIKARCGTACRRLMARSTTLTHGAVNDMPIVKHRSMVSGTTLRVMGRQALGLQSWRVARRFTTMIKAR